ncbi:MAG: DJ-1/PfpI family protein [Candidatus Acidiferrales bacterium]
MTKRGMTRRELLRSSGAVGCAAAVPFALAGCRSAVWGAVQSTSAAGSVKPAGVSNALKPPASGSIPVAFLVSEGAQVIDFTGPWEVFQDVMVPGGTEDAFQLYTVAETTNLIHATGGMKIIPDYTLKTAPPPKVIVIPAQGGGSKAMLEWIRKSTANTDVTMSVCTGAFLLARTGLLSGKAATTHHGSYSAFAKEFPDIEVKRGCRFVEEGNIATAGGLTSGIDLALRVVERYYGREVAERTAYDLEYQGKGWMDASGAANAAYAEVTDGPTCLVCGMSVDPKVAMSSVYKGQTYYFCSRNHKDTFDGDPEKWVKARYRSNR